MIIGCSSCQVMTECGACAWFILQESAKSSKKSQKFPVACLQQANACATFHTRSPPCGVHENCRLQNYSEVKIDKNSKN